MGRFSYYGERYTLYDKDVKKLQKKLEELRYELEHGLLCQKKIKLQLMIGFIPGLKNIRCHQLSEEP